MANREADVVCLLGKPEPLHSVRARLGHLADQTLDESLQVERLCPQPRLAGTHTDVLHLHRPSASGLEVARPAFELAEMEENWVEQRLLLAIAEVCAEPLECFARGIEVIRPLQHRRPRQRALEEGRQSLLARFVPLERGGGALAQIRRRASAEHEPDRVQRGARVVQQSSMPGNLGEPYRRARVRLGAVQFPQLSQREAEIALDSRAQGGVSACLDPGPFEERDDWLEASLVRFGTREPSQDPRPVLAGRERRGEFVKLAPRPTRLARVPQIVARGDRPSQRVLSQLGRRSRNACSANEAAASGAPRAPARRLASSSAAATSASGSSVERPR